MKIKELLSSHHKWTKDALARNNTSDMVDPISSDAARFCLIGAAEKCYRDGMLRKAVVEKMEKYIHEEYGSYEVDYFNDHSNFKEVKSMVEKLDI